eukprot:CAMPEP_0184534364 /NCGR_PEP_ID=MMETSP0198_2-20121128/15284_1 /TAXON_ID=1112570 /ORGANISM="Thraustochytrium sp., Strain LLF1b" /LENGTH=138 /DNA_ID=CAMNT_0026927269 /DNA_START=166 /DNA_END=579 /DNA_ORIENTATION=+
MRRASGSWIRRRSTSSKPDPKFSQQMSDGHFATESGGNHFSSINSIVRTHGSRSEQKASFLMSSMLSQNLENLDVGGKKYTSEVDIPSFYEIEMEGRQKATRPMSAAVKPRRSSIARVRTRFHTLLLNKNRARKRRTD